VAQYSRRIYSGIIEFRGSTIVDVPPNLKTGLDIVVSLSVYILAKAFKPPNNRQEADYKKPMFDEGAETAEERELRERKQSLLKLFDTVNLRPVRGSGVLGKKKATELSHDEVLKMAEVLTQSQTPQPKPQGVRKEIVGDGEEVEVEPGEDLNENQLTMIYNRCSNTTLPSLGRTDVVVGLNSTTKQWLRWTPPKRLPCRYVHTRNRA
jgi:DNA repair protein RAD5